MVVARFEDVHLEGSRVQRARRWPRRAAGAACRGTRGPSGPWRAATGSRDSPPDPPIARRCLPSGRRGRYRGDHDRSTTRWGILGTGRIAGTFAADLRHVPGAELAAVGSRTPDRAKAFAAEHDAARAHGSWAELAADPDVDVIYVATPHASHHDATMACLEAGRSVLMRKADDPGSGHLGPARRGGPHPRAFLMEAMWMRCNPAIRKIRELIREGAIGDIVTLHADLGLQGPFAATHRLRDPALGGGALLDLGVYPIHLADLLLGARPRCRARPASPRKASTRRPASCSATPRRAVAALTCSISGASRNAATITGTRGRIELPAGLLRAAVLRPASGTDRRGDIRLPVRGVGLPVRGDRGAALPVRRLPESPLVPHLATLEVMTLLDTIRAADRRRLRRIRSPVELTYADGLPTTALSGRPEAQLEIEVLRPTRARLPRDVRPNPAPRPDLGTSASTANRP